jgi:hypothetical protein
MTQLLAVWEDHFAAVGSVVEPTAEWNWPSGRSYVPIGSMEAGVSSLERSLAMYRTWATRSVRRAA